MAGATGRAEQTRAFVAGHVLATQEEFDGDIAGAGGEQFRRRVQVLARAAGPLSSHAPADCGVLGLNMSERAPVLEEAGCSLFGPVALNINAPDEDNPHLLAHVASAGQRDRFLKPLAAGDVRSEFTMTEPSPDDGPTYPRCAAGR